MEHRRNNETDHAYNMGFTDGYSKGRYEVLNTIAEILKESKYPEYLEEDIAEYLKMEGIIDGQNY